MPEHVDRGLTEVRRLRQAPGLSSASSNVAPSRFIAAMMAG
jgi:hypothetical protein